MKVPLLLSNDYTLAELEYLGLFFDFEMITPDKVLVCVEVVDR